MRWRLTLRRNEALSVIRRSFRTPRARRRRRAASRRGKSRRCSRRTRACASAPSRSTRRCARAADIELIEGAFDGIMAGRCLARRRRDERRDDQPPHRRGGGSAALLRQRRRRYGAVDVSRSCGGRSVAADRCDFQRRLRADAGAMGARTVGDAARSTASVSRRDGSNGIARRFGSVTWMSRRAAASISAFSMARSGAAAIAMRLSVDYFATMRRAKARWRWSAPVRAIRVC